MLLGIPLLYALLACVGFARAHRARRAPIPPHEPHGISVLKPLAGADPALAENLESFFAQDHGDFELLLGVESPSDPAIPVARAVMARHPEVPARLVIHGEGTRAAANPKVRNLMGLWPLARNERILISDSNIEAPRDLLRDLDARMEERTGLVSNLVAGARQAGLGGQLDAAQLSGFVAAGVIVPALVRDPVVLGKSMMVRRSALERLGGLESVASVLAEDYLIGKMLQHGGWELRLGTRVVRNVVGRLSTRAYLERQLRWSMLRMRLHPLAFALEPLTSPLVAALLAASVFGAPGLVLAPLLVVARDLVGWLALRGVGGAWVVLLGAPLRELAALAIWAATPWVKRISWRGNAVRLGAGTRAFVADPALADGEL